MRATTPRRGRFKYDRLGHLAIYAVAIVLGVLAAYAFLSTAPFKPPPTVSGEVSGESTERGHLHRTHGHTPAIPVAAGGQQQQHKSSDGSGGGGQHVHTMSSEEEAWYKKLDSHGCKATEALRVCSHRAKSEELQDVASGSLSAYGALWRAKVKCFDIDYVATSDGQLIASHPDDLLRVLDPAKFGQLKEGKHSLAEIRAGGADEEHFPTAETVLQVLAKLLDQEEDKWWLKEGHAIDYARLPGIFMDLKGPAFNKEMLARIGKSVEELHLTPFVAVFVMGPEQQALAQAAGFKGPLIRCFQDKTDPNPQLAAAELARYAMLGPSIKMGDAFFKAAAKMEKAMHAWTVDKPADLYRALKVGVDSAISNRPLALRQVLFDWRDKCSDQL